jgi:hypothetical protein
MFAQTQEEDENGEAEDDRLPVAGPALSDPGWDGSRSFSGVDLGSAVVSEHLNPLLSRVFVDVTEVPSSVLDLHQDCNIASCIDFGYEVRNFASRIK